MRVAGLVAAAGTSSRMGVPKALLPFQRDGTLPHAQRSFVRTIVDVFVASGLQPVIVTVPDDDAVTKQIAHELAHAPAVLVRNNRPDEGLTGSVVTGLSHALGSDALVLTPVDCPFVDVTLVQALVRALEVSPAAVPSVRGLWGHPVAFQHRAFGLLSSAGARGGPRAVLAELGAAVHAVEWADPRVCDNINTPEDYARCFGCNVPMSRP